MEPERIKHLEFIQAVITRMNTNSFQIKTWCVTVVAGFLAIYASSKIPVMIALAIPPALMFWILDSYYLMQERKFRGLYNDVAGVTEKPQELKVFEMRPDVYKKGKYSFWNVFRSTTILSMYLPIIMVLVVVFLIALAHDC